MLVFTMMKHMWAIQHCSPTSMHWYNCVISVQHQILHYLFQNNSHICVLLNIKIAFLNPNSTVQALVSIIGKYPSTFSAILLLETADQTSRDQGQVSHLSPFFSWKHRKRSDPVGSSWQPPLANPGSF